MSNYLTVAQVSEKFPAFSESSIRYHLFYSKQNNLEKAIRRVGRKILISETEFINWIENQNNGGAL